MTRLITILCIILSLNLQVSAQQNAANADSLRAVLQAVKTEDSARVTNLLNLSYAILFENLDSAIVVEEEAMNLSRKIHFQKGIAFSLRQKGLIYYYQGDFITAIDYSQQALKEGQTLQNGLFEASVYNNIANIYADLGQSKKALEYYKKLLAAAKEMNHKTFEMNALVNIGTVYVELKRYDEALEALHTSLVIAKIQNDNNIAAPIYNNMGTAYKKKGDVDRAMHSFRTALQIARENNHNSTIALSLSNIAQLYSYTGKYDSARWYALESLRYSKPAKAIQWQSEAYETLSIVYEKQHQAELALDAYKQFIALRDSMINDEKKQEITRKEMEFEAEKKEALLNSKHASEIQQQKIIKNVAVTGAIFLLAAALFLFAFYKRKNDAVTRQHEAELKAEIGDTEMKALRAQMNPHFIFNSLNSINDYISKNDTHSAETYLTKFAKLMRMVLENSDQKQVPLSDDLKALELYMQLESLRLNKKFTYQIKVDDNIDMENTLVPPLILQPFVENSIWHGLAAKEGEGLITINIHKQGNMINCIVEDNGVGRMPETANEESVLKKKSLGMKITKSRIEIINKLKNANATVSIFHLPEGTKAEVSLPLELSF